MKSQGQADISDATLLKVAKEKAEELNIKPFSGSGGWLSNFKHRQACHHFSQPNQTTSLYAHLFITSTPPINSFELQHLEFEPDDIQCASVSQYTPLIVLDDLIAWH